MSRNIGAVWVFNSRIFALKCMLEMRKCREWIVNRSQNMGPNYGKFFGHLGQSVTAQKNQWASCVEIVH